MDYHGSVYGGLAHLLLKFCDEKKLDVPLKLLNIQNLEQFPYSLWYDILNELEQLYPSPALGLEIAEYLQVKHLGILGYLAQSCVNLGEALQRSHHFHRLLFDGSPLLVTTSQAFLIIRWDVPDVFTTQLTDETAIAIMYQFLKHFLHIDDIQLEEIHFSHPKKRALIAHYSHYFRCKVLFSQAQTQIKIPLNMFLTPLLHADQTLQNLLMQQAQELLAKLPHTSQLDERLQQAILKGLQKNDCHIETISQQLHLSVRQLQRHLQQCSSTYQQRVQQVRLLLAQQYLKDPHLSLHEIALLLGYSEQSAFQRAFKKWTHQTPQNWRNHLHNKYE